MLTFLFRRLTAEQPRGALLFAAVSAEARKPHWYVEGQVPDTIDGRFAMLATIAALALVRLERDAEQGNLASVALTERFVDVMKTEHRELGLGDPALGKQVRKLVGSLAGRVELWRRATAAEVEWVEATQRSVYKDQVSPDALAHAALALGNVWARLDRLDLGALIDGRLE